MSKARFCIREEKSFTSVFGRVEWEGDGFDVPVAKISAAPYTRLTILKTLATPRHRVDELRI